MQPAPRRRRISEGFVEAMEARDRARTAGAEAWPVNWSAAWVGALAGIALVVLVGLVGTAIGAHRAGVEGRISDLSNIGTGGIFVAVFGTFLSFVAAGWIAARVAGLRSAEAATLHGAIAFLLAVVVLLFLGAVGAGWLSGWYAGFAPAPAAPPTAPGTPVDPALAKAARAGAAAGAGAMLLGLMGSVVGGWLASGEPMTLAPHWERYRGRLRMPGAGGTRPGPL
jgi:hypothetical protein